MKVLQCSHLKQGHRYFFQSQFDKATILILLRFAEFQQDLPEGKQEKIVEISRRHTAILEGYIRKYPEQMVLDAQQVEVLKISRNLVVQTAFPGDSVLTLPFLQELKRLEPESEIDVVCSPSCLEIFEASPVVSKVLPFDKRSEYKGFRGIARFAAQVKENDYSKIYSLHRSFKIALLVSLIRGEETIGFSTKQFFVFVR